MGLERQRLGWRFCFFRASLEPKSFVRIIYSSCTILVQFRPGKLFGMNTYLTPTKQAS
jgi:hypothetical protein